jgi:hypothetical protein
MRPARGSTDQLLAKLPGARISRWHNPDRLGHNGWIARPDGTVDRIARWVRDLR